MSGLDAPLDQIFGQLIEFGSAQGLHQVFGHAVHRHDVRQIDLGAGCRGQLDLRFLGCLLQTLKGHRVFSKIQAFIVLELIGQPVDDLSIEIVTTQVGITIRAQNLEYTISQFKDGHVMCSSSEVEDHDLLIDGFLIQSIGKGSCCRFIDDTLDL